MTFAGAIRQGLREELRRDPSVVMIGEEIGVYGGALTVTMRLIDEFGPERIIDTPISENTIIGVSMGMAIMGMKPVAEIMYMDFLQLAMEQLVTQASRARFMSGGRISLPLVVRTQYSLGRSAGPQHSQFFPSCFSQAPGLKVVLPSTPASAKGLLKTAIRDGNPVLFIEAANLYSTQGLVPGGDYTIPFGKAEVSRTGTDATVVAFSRVLPEAMAAAEELATRGIELEVIDPRTVQPLDKQTIVDSVKKTNRLLIAADDYAIGGLGSVVLSALQEEIFYHLEAPVKLVGPPLMPAPASTQLEQEFMVDRKDIESSVGSLLTS